MINKIIQKEKDRQEGFFTSIKIFSSSGFADANKGAINQINFSMKMHKEFLINLKEHFEDPGFLMNFNTDCECCMLTSRERREHLIQLKKDKKELTKMIEKYK